MRIHTLCSYMGKCSAVRTRTAQALVYGELVLWEDKTWVDVCPVPCCCLAALCCSATSWTVTTLRIDKQSGCCGTTERTLDLRRVTDLSYQASGRL